MDYNMRIGGGRRARTGDIQVEGHFLRDFSQKADVRAALFFEAAQNCYYLLEQGSKFQDRVWKRG